MRSKLSLRIPGLQELSPPPALTKTSSNRRNSDIPISPKLIPQKKPSKLTPCSSSYSRITSSVNLKNFSLPSFMQINLKQTEKPSNPVQLFHSLISNNSDCLTDASSEVNLKVSAKQPCNNLESFEDFLGKVYQNPENLTLKIGKLDIKFKELRILEPQSVICKIVIDACFFCFKHQNKSIFKSQESHDRVLIMDTEFSQNVFSLKPENKIPFKRNPLKVEYILMPVYIGHWILVVVDNRHKKVVIYNLHPNEEVIKEHIFTNIKEFIRRELKFHEKIELEYTSWREFTCEISSLGGVNEKDSDLYIIRIAYKIAINNKAVVSKEILNSFRRNLLQMLFKNGSVQKTNY